MAKRPIQYHPNLVQIRPQYADMTARVHENVLWFMGSVAQGYSLTQLTAIGTAFGNVMGQTWAHYGAPNSTYTGEIVTDWTSANGLSSSVSQPAPGIGTGEYPANTAILISEKQGIRYKGGHGRIYLPCLSTLVSTDGINVPAAVQTYYNGQFSSLYNAMLALSAANGGPCQPVIYRQGTQVVPPTTPPTYQPAFTSAVNSYVCSTMLATQRRRLRKAPHH
jgi:hypothetical protein